MTKEAKPKIIAAKTVEKKISITKVSDIIAKKCKEEGITIIDWRKIIPVDFNKPRKGQ